MSTRKLILTALVCGLAIVVAGAAKLLQVAGSDTRITVLALGKTVDVADMTVTVSEVRQTTGETLVTVSMLGVEGADAAEGWRLLAGSEVLAPADTQGGERCADTRQAVAESCTLHFPATRGSVTVAYLRGGAQMQWAP